MGTAHLEAASAPRTHCCFSGSKAPSHTPIPALQLPWGNKHFCLGFHRLKMSLTFSFCHCSEWSFLPQRMSCQVQEGAALAQDHSCYRRSFLDSENSTNSLFSFSSTGSEAFNTFPLPAWTSNEWQNEHSPHTAVTGTILLPSEFQRGWHLTPVPVRTVCTTWIYSNCSSTHHCRSNCYTPATGEDVPDSVSAGTGLMWLWLALWGLLFWAIFAPRRTTENAYRVFSNSSDLVRSLPLGDLGPGEAFKPRLLLLLPQFRPDFPMPEATTTL